MDAEEITRFEVVKSLSTFQLLFKAARLTNELALSALRQTPGMENLRASHTSLLPFLDYEGTRISVLADRMGISKQAVQQLVDELEAMGGVHRIPDPTDGRAKLVKFRNGALFNGINHLRALEDHVAQALPDGHLGSLRSILVDLIQALESNP